MGGLSTNGECGPLFAGNKTCTGTQFGTCCSNSGYCGPCAAVTNHLRLSTYADLVIHRSGSTSDYCAVGNCYSGDCGGVSSSSASSASTSGSAACASATAVAVTFDELVTTSYGDSVYLVGSIAQLGSWDASEGIAMSASQYTTSNPLWSLTVSFPPGTSMEYKFITIDDGGNVTWVRETASTLLG